MSQQAHFVATATPADIGADLDPGCYLGMVSGRLEQDLDGIFYATRETAPSDPCDYFEAGAGASFTFSVGDDIPPTWVRAAFSVALGPGRISVARAKL